MTVGFIGGTSFAGKTTLAKRLRKEFGVEIVSLDSEHWRYSQGKELPYSKSFFAELAGSTSRYWGHEVRRAEFMTPHFLYLLSQLESSSKHNLFDGVHLVPHVARGLGLEGVYLVHESIDTLFDRIESRRKKEKKGAREDSWWLNMVRSIWFCSERVREEGTQYGYNVFDNSEEAYAHLRLLFGGSP